ncbi:MAG TPA: hypothetical protein ACFE0H_15400 [Elainellaceae cyanobacterium]
MTVRLRPNPSLFLAAIAALSLGAGACAPDATQETTQETEGTDETEVAAAGDQSNFDLTLNGAGA